MMELWSCCIRTPRSGGVGAATGAAASAPVGRAGAAADAAAATGAADEAIAAGAGTTGAGSAAGGMIGGFTGAAAGAVLSPPAAAAAAEDGGPMSDMRAVVRRVEVAGASAARLPGASPPVPHVSGGAAHNKPAMTMQATDMRERDMTQKFQAAR